MLERGLGQLAGCGTYFVCNDEVQCRSASGHSRVRVGDRVRAQVPRLGDEVLTARAGSSPSRTPLWC